MVKKKVATRKKKKAAAIKAPKVGELTLPKAPKEATHNFFDYVTLIYGRQGIGKTSFMAEFPDAILFSCERVSKGIKCFDFNSENGGVTSWEIFKQGVKLLKKTTRFKVVCIDTIDAAYKMCDEHICKMNGVSSASDIEWGKGWKLIREEFGKVLDEIWRSGRGIVFSSHAKENMIESASGEKYTRIIPSMSNQAFDYAKAKTDFILYAEYVKVKGVTTRVLFSQGDEVVEAKHADVAGFPAFLPMTKGKGLQTLLDAFAGKDVGLDPKLVRPSVQTGEAATASLRTASVKRAKKGMQKTAATKTKKKVRRRK